MTEKERITIMATKILNSIRKDIKVMSSDPKMQAKIINELIKQLAQHK